MILASCSSSGSQSPKGHRSYSPADCSRPPSSFSCPAHHWLPSCDLPVLPACLPHLLNQQDLLHWPSQLQVIIRCLSYLACLTCLPDFACSTLLDHPSLLCLPIPGHPASSGTLCGRIGVQPQSSGGPTSHICQGGQIALMRD